MYVYVSKVMYSRYARNVRSSSEVHYSEGITSAQVIWQKAASLCVGLNCKTTRRQGQNSKAQAKAKKWS